MLDRRYVMAMALGGALAASSVAWAADPDPAVARVEAFNQAIVTLSKGGAITAPRIRPTIEQYFNLPFMAQVAVGPSWSGMSGADRQLILDAMNRYTETRYAFEFRDFSGQTIAVDPAAQVRGPDHLVKAEVREKGEAPVKIGYRLREFNGSWKIIDVFYQGVSQLATQRSDFAGALASGGAPALAKKLDAATAKLK
jgi:phospholipid transport system substrate-binding protein